ncbi:hypothetical protein H4582DRAFT_2085463 [Lactarius indigo]|nr:hypothetical protein H4582DRAFT_2085463 [Lactarius indigo]
MSPQRPPGTKTYDWDSSSLEAIPAQTPPATPFVSQPPLIHKVSSTFVRPHLPLVSLLLSCSGLAYFNFTFALVTTVALVSAFFKVLATTFTHPHKFRNKTEDIGNSQNSALGFKTCGVFAHPDGSRPAVRTSFSTLEG